MTYSRKITYSAVLGTSLHRNEGNEPDMANHFSALKRARQTEKRSVRNRANTSRLRGALRDLRESLAKGDKAGAEAGFPSDRFRAG